MIQEKQTQQNHLAEFIDKLKAAAENNLICLTVYGSAASTEFHPEFSDINMLCVVRDISAASLQALTPAIHWWTANKFPAPLVFSRQDIAEAAKVFPIEMIDIRQQHHTVYGEDIFAKLDVPLDRHRFQLEHDLRTKLLFLRQNYLLANGDQRKIRSLMLDSVSSFVTLFRHALLAMKQDAPRSKEAVLQQLASKLQFDASPILQLLEVRQRKASAEGINAHALFDRYIQTIQRVIQGLEAM